MCNDCFIEEIKSFPTWQEFENFDVALTKKIVNDKTIQLKRFVNSGWKDIGYYEYECHKCGQFWKLAEPDLAFRGYFLKM